MGKLISGLAISAAILLGGSVVVKSVFVKHEPSAVVQGPVTITAAPVPTAKETKVGFTPPVANTKAAATMAGEYNLVWHDKPYGTASTDIECPRPEDSIIVLEGTLKETNRGTNKLFVVHDSVKVNKDNVVIEAMVGYYVQRPEAKETECRWFGKVTKLGVK